jgi:phosphonopyruvate decarboxylase
MEMEVLFKTLKSLNINFFCGVPDSLLTSFCDYLLNSVNNHDHIIAANEGGAIGLAIGHYLATGNLSVVYMQNSGLGNAVNPLLSLASRYVYSIPMLIVIGWRGELKDQDEPQHIHYGKITLEMLDTMGISYEILDHVSLNDATLIQKLVNKSYETSSPVALIVKKGIFDKKKIKHHVISLKNNLYLNRYDALSCILNNISDSDIIVSSTGMISREVDDLIQEKYPLYYKNCFFTIGGMGHTSQIALSLSLIHKKKRVFCLEGDGSMLMHLGSLAVAAQSSDLNFHYILINNGVHQSVGSQPTIGFNLSIPDMAKSFGFDFVQTAKTEEEINLYFHNMKIYKKKSFLEIQINLENPKKVGRPIVPVQQRKRDFMSFLQSNK